MTQTIRRCSLLLVSALVLVGSVACSDRSERSAPTIRRAVEPAPAVAVDPGDSKSIRYTLRFKDRKNHYVDLEAVFPAGGESVELTMAVWTPGSYLIREFSRQIASISAASPEGEPLDIVKLAKNRWRVKSPSVSHVVVRYRLYARELSVRTNFVSEEIAVLNGASTFLTMADEVERGFDIALEVPEEWKESVTGLEPHPDGKPHHYVAPDFDTLVDSPIVIGNPELYELELEGSKHILANFGGGDVWDGPRSAKDIEAIIRANLEFWRVVPYRRYVFQNVLLGGRSGLEHKNSTLVTSSRWRMRERKDYIGWLGLMSHEFFHVWNVKRLRPVELGPFDYEAEVYTRSLWVAEGITSYYDSLLIRRAELVDDKEYFDLLSFEIEKTQTTPGRAVQSLADSSLDAWIKFYRADENASNTQVSYYRKGAVVGFLLDVEIRRATGGQRSLDDVMRLVYERYSGERGFTPQEFRAAASEVAGRSLDAFFAHAVDGTGELDYAPALELFGLRFADQSKADDKDDSQADKPAYIGADVSNGMVQKVTEGTPAYAAGINVGDEILAIDDYRVKPGRLDARLERYRPGDQVSILVARQGALRRISLTLGEPPTEAWKLEIDPRANQTAARNRTRWLTGSDPR